MTLSLYPSVVSNKEVRVSVVQSFGELVQPLSVVMTTPTFLNFVTVLTVWLFAQQHTVTATIVATGRCAHKHHSAYHRVFANAQRSLDELGLAVATLCLRSVGNRC